MQHMEDAEHVGNAWRRQSIGLIGGILAAIAVYFLFPADAVELVNQANPEAKTPYVDGALRITAAAAVLMGVWWMTEAIPLAATALVPLALFPLLQVSPIRTIGASYGDPTIFLFMGGFILALALERANLHRRLALGVVLAVGTRPRQMVLGFMLATGVMSMWVSNTATAVVMIPIGISVLKLTADVVGGLGKIRRFSTAMMLGIAYSASIGSLGTPIGTPPNALLLGYLNNQGIHVGFGQWMLVGVPLAVVFMIVAWLLLTTVFRPEVNEIPGGRAIIRDELHGMGTMSTREWMVGIIFAITALCWIFVPIAIDHFGWEVTVADAAIGMCGALLLFMIPANFRTGERLMDWQTATKLPWDVLLLFGGGLALSKMFGDSGLSLYIGELAKGLGGLPMILLIAAIAAMVIFLTEFTSNTATAAAFLPIMGGVATGIGLTDGAPQNVMLLCIPVALAATCAFMLPVATPPNAIAYGSGVVKIGEMVRGGLWLNLIGIVLITIVTYFLAVPVFGLVL
ncbi:MAG: DASS family sodium-coupled anion symporter [Corynebacterium sp.]|nr:DASS family sodium-coupled anion symporter [Corynebacterium sp.]